MADAVLFIISFSFLLTRQLITTAIVIPAEAGHAVKPWRYPDRSWIPDQVRDDKGWSIELPV